MGVKLSRWKKGKGWERMDGSWEIYKRKREANMGRCGHTSAGENKTLLFPGQCECALLKRLFLNPTA